MNKLKLLGLVFGGLIFILILLNPSPQRFKEYLGESTLNKYEIVTRRSFNGFIFSVYERQIIVKESGYYTFKDPEKFYGFCLNFIRAN